jgi:hypothetical protein
MLGKSSSVINPLADNLRDRNASALIDEYWRKFKKEKQEKQSGRKSDPKPAAKGRKSVSEQRDVTPSTKRNKPKAKAVKEVEQSEEEEEEEERPAKKPRKNSSTTAKKATKREKTPEPEPEDEDEPLGNMKKHMTISSWENLVTKVDTVERVDGELWCYFTMSVSSALSSRIVTESCFRKGGEHVRESAKLCAERFPQKVCFEAYYLCFPDVLSQLQLIQFYESNLKWKAEDSAASADES